jgi:AcrR family transcriptional regulator
MTQRAYDSISKDQRRHVILAAASSLFEQRNGALPSVAQIADAAGLGKGTIYIYYRSKEEIFAALLLERWLPALRILEEEFTYSEASLARRIEGSISRFVEYVSSLPILLRLDALSKEVLERNMSQAALAAHKNSILRDIDRIGKTIELALSLQPGRGFKLLTRTHAMTRGLWQSFGDTASDCGLNEHRHPDFANELQEALLEYWRGALASDGADVSADG